MTFLPIAQLEVTDRQRKEISSKELVELKRSILSKGLLHAPVLSYPGPLYRLVAGERRLRAMIELHEEGLTFTYNNDTVPLDHLPFTLIGDLTPANLQEAELEENILRMPLTWMEEAEAKSKIHQLRINQAAASGEKPPSLLSTVNYIESKKGLAPEDIKKVASARTTDLHRSLIVAQNKNDPDVKAAKSLAQAWTAVLDKQEQFFKALLVEKTGHSHDNLKLIHGDCVEGMSHLEPSTFDLIFVDPPYGIGADTMKYDSKHNYDDTVDTAMKVCQEILSTGFALAKPRATLLMWCDIQHFVFLRDAAAMQGWTPWRVPIIWHKGEQGHAPWGRAGFVRTYEALLFAVKGQKELYIPGGSDVISIKSTSNVNKRHAAEKPIEIIQYLLEKATIEGDRVLDPCCGSGVIFEAGFNLKLNVTGFELSKQYYDIALARIGDLSNAEKNNDSPLIDYQIDLNPAN